MVQTLYHRLILPADANHKNTLCAGSLLRLALEARLGTTDRRLGLCPLALQLNVVGSFHTSAVTDRLPTSSVSLSRQNWLVQPVEQRKPAMQREVGQKRSK
jgi:hypothetical protein